MDCSVMNGTWKTLADKEGYEEEESTVDARERLERLEETRKK